MGQASPAVEAVSPPSPSVDGESVRYSTPQPGTAEHGATTVLALAALALVFAARARFSRIRRAALA